ncbi:MAG: HAD-IC family P-type ATPase [Isosphaeraceae bacterium]|nr:HAD-IC family P-type ATPase [Isosphaeraceae bacterium]
MARRPVPLARLSGLDFSTRGLSRIEAEERRRDYGANDIVESPPHPWWDLARDTAKDPMLWFFAGTGILYAAIGQRTEAVTLLAAILPLVGMDVYLHRRTQASTAGLKTRLAAAASVVRDGQVVGVPAVDVVPGDLALVSPGEPFPADGVIVEGSRIQVDESALTGEAYPVPKRPLGEPPGMGDAPAVDEEHWAFAGTRLLTGEAKVRIVYTGGETLYGEIVRSAVHGSHEVTPLQAAIGRLVKALVVGAVALCLALATVRLYQGHGWLDALISAVTLATAAIPEEFSVVFTFFLGVGVFRMARQQALVRRAVTVENIGRVTCICSDKTGTLTEGRLVLTHMLPAGTADECRLLKLASIASRHDSGDPMDEAIFRLSDRDPTGPAAEVVATFPFTEDRKRETAVVRLGSGLRLAATKGAAEVVLGMCSLNDAERAGWHERIAQLAEGAHKVIAVASRELDSAPNRGGEPSEGFEFAGLLAFEDPVREGVREAVLECRSAGIHPIMVTGDHPITAKAVAKILGLGEGEPRLLLGDDLEARLRDGPLHADVIARAKPAQKLLLVKALQEAGAIVAVTGDGVNDVPALQAADVGVAMGERGTRSAREVASIVLLDDNFRTIVGAIREGRQLFRNLRSSFEYLLIVHIPLVLTATLIPLAGYPLLYLPVHIVWLEIVIHPTAMLAFQERAARGLSVRKGRAGPARFFAPMEWATIAATGVLVTAMVMAGYLRSLEGVGNVEHGRAMALGMYTVTAACVAAALSRLRTTASRVVFTATLLSSFAFIQIPGLDDLLHLQALHWDDWALVGLGGILAGGLPLLSGHLAGRARTMSMLAQSPAVMCHSRGS